MRILHIIHSVNPAHGGTTTALRALVSSCESLGHPSPVITLDTPESPWLNDWHSPIVGVGPCLTHYGWTPHLLPLLEKEVPLSDLVVVHGLWQYHGTAVRNVCLTVKKSYLVYPHGMLDPWALRQSWMKRLRKSINWHITTRRVLRDADRLCFTCEEEHESALPALKSIQTLPAILPLGVEGPPDDVITLKKEWQEEHTSSPETRILLFLGRLHPKKGCDLLLEAFARWKKTSSSSAKVCLRMVGPADSTEYLSYLQALCSSLGLVIEQDVCFPGMADGRLKWQELAAANALILPSHQENFGIVVGEALACNLPVLLSTRVNTWRWVTEAGAGFAAEPTATGIEILLRQWIDQLPDEDTRMKCRAGKLFEDRFSPDSTTQQFIRLCALVCDQ